MTRSSISKIKAFKQNLEGDIYTDNLHRIIYSTDASVYREMPQAVAYPKNEEDLVKIVQFCLEEGLSIIPRAAGTSLAGQVVGNGVICDISKYMNRILEINPSQATVRVQPGVIRDVLNLQLKKHGLFFGPNTSTSNRCMIGGMIGNNSSGTTSIKFGTTRDKLKELRVILSNGSIATVGKEGSSSSNTFIDQITQTIIQTYSDAGLQAKILSSFPKSEIHRRNTGYALDVIVNSLIAGNERTLNLASLLCGSEGTLALTSEATLELDVLPPPFQNLLCVEFASIKNAMLSVVQIMKHQPYQCELMDEVILNCSKGHPQFGPYLNLLSGQPKAVLMVEVRGENRQALAQEVESVNKTINTSGLAEHVSVLNDAEAQKMWSLRKAGLGLLANIPGDNKAVACIEDTAVSLVDLPEYIGEFEAMMASFGQKAVYYAHAGAGELHLRPILNLKRSEDVKLFEAISQASAQLVKKYGGSLSGEHGDGRVRSPFIKDLVGEEVYGRLAEMKQLWDPNNLFNPGKIIDPKPMTDDLRYEPDQPHVEIPTTLSFKMEGGILRAAEKCNGSGDCRKTEQSPGTMCPSYHATKNEKDTTRARANVLREILTTGTRSNKFDNPELKEVMDLCLSCKACAKECPSRLDMASMKSEFLHQYHKSNRRPLRDYLFGFLPTMNQNVTGLVRLATLLMNSRIGSGLRDSLGISKFRKFPQVRKTPAHQRLQKFKWNANRVDKVDLVLYLDEFSNFFEPDIVNKAIELLQNLGFKIMLSPPLDSCRSRISKGFLISAKRELSRQVELFKSLINSQTPLVGIEASAILGFRDEVPKIVDTELSATSNSLAKITYTIEEFLLDTYEKGRWASDSFNQESAIYHVHGHCHFKAKAREDALYHLLDLVPNAEVFKISSGCCGMAGAFGYEKEHFEISQMVGESSLFPYLRKINNEAVIVAQGTSCRHQIFDALNRPAIHPIEVLHHHLL